MNLATIVVVPRDHFSHTTLSIETLYANTPPLPVIVVDGGSPAPIRDWLAAESRTRGFGLIRANNYLSPNQARNLGLATVRTPYAIFLDNDALVTSGWYEALITCAEETGASLVGPLYGIGPIAEGRCHMAGGVAHIDERDGRRYLVEVHRYGYRRIDDIRGNLRREPSELLEFHCMLVRMEGIASLGPFDEGLPSQFEHIDICLAVRQAGEGVWFEPSSMVTYMSPPPVERSDKEYFRLRWSKAWTETSIDRFCSKWRIPKNDAKVGQLRAFNTSRRRLSLPVPIRKAVNLVTGWRARVEDLLRV